MAQSMILDWTGTPIELPKKLEATSQAEIGRVQDKWAATVLRDVSAETLARVARNTAPLPDHMTLCDKIFLDGHFLATAEDYTSSVAGRDWDVLPYVDSPGGKPTTEDKKIAESIGAMLYNAPGLDQYFEHLAWGDGLYPLAGAETIWNLNTYLPARFELIDAVRWNWANDNTLRLLTALDSREGERLKAANWTTHTRNPQNPRKNRQHKALAFFYMCARFAIIDLLSVSEKFGKPIPIAYFEDGADKDALVEAVMQVGTEFAGVFPKSVKVELMQALDMKSTIQQGLAQWAYDQVTKLNCGHVLVVEAKSGSGTLGGNGAQITNLKKAAPGCRRLAGSVRQGLLRPLAWFHHGAKALARCPYLVFKLKPPEDEEKKARAYVSWNEVLEPLGLAIDGEHVKEAAGVPLLVPRPTTSGQPSGELISQIRETLKDFAAGLIEEEGAVMSLKRAGVPEEEARAVIAATEKAELNVPAPVNPADKSADNSADNSQDNSPDKKPAEQRARLRRTTQSQQPVKIRTLADISATSTLLGERGDAARSASIVERAQQAAEAGTPLRDFLDSLYEAADAIDATKDAELLAQAMVVAGAIGAGDAAAARGGGRS